jgi:hypothetical protein
METPDFAAVAQLAADSDSVELDCPEIDDQQIVNAIRAYKDAEALKDALIELVMPTLRQAFVAKCREAGKVFKSANCRGIQFVFQMRYTPLSAANTIGSAKARVGDERFVQMFAPAYSYEVPISKVDAELFAELTKRGIRPKMVLKPTQAYHEASILEDGFGEVSPDKQEELKAKKITLQPLPKNVSYVQKKPEVVDGKEVFLTGSLPATLPSVLRPVQSTDQSMPVQQPVQVAPVPSMPVKKVPETVSLKVVRREVRKAIQAIAEVSK